MAYDPVALPTFAIAIMSVATAVNKPGASILIVDPSGAIAHLNPGGGLGPPDPAGTVPTCANWCIGTFPTEASPFGMALFIPQSPVQQPYVVNLVMTGPL